MVGVFEGVVMNVDVMTALAFLTTWHGAKWVAEGVSDEFPMAVVVGLFALLVAVAAWVEVLA